MQLPLSTTLSNDELAEVFAFIAQVLRMKGSNPYRARAYEEAGVVIHQLPYELVERFAQLQKSDPAVAAKLFAKQLDELPGIGEHIAAKLAELFSTGTIKAFQKYVANLPGGMYPLVQLYGIGVKKAYYLANHFQLANPATAIDELLVAAQQGQVKDLPGFGEKSQQDLIQALEQQYKKARIPYAQAVTIATKIKEALEQSPQVSRVTFLGSLRRGAETVGDIDLGAIITNIAQAKQQIKTLSFVKRVLVAGDNMIRLIVDHNWQVDLKLSPADEWGSFIQHFTGSKEHNIRLRELAIKQDLSLSEHGIKDKITGQIKKFSTEKAFYRFLGLDLIPPAERVGGAELEKYRLT